MKKGLVIGLATTGVIVLVLGITTVTQYNSLVTLHEDVAGYKADIVVSLRARNVVIDDLVTAAGAYLDHESEIYTAITDARSDFATAADSSNYADIIAADESTSLALSNLLAFVEDTPELSGDNVIISLMGSMETAEYTIRIARIDYNDAVEIYNTEIKLFPTILFAKMFNYDEPLPYWETTEGGEIEVVFPLANV
jgi:LemA protein